jgi:hypothetical protein
VAWAMARQSRLRWAGRRSRGRPPARPAGCPGMAPVVRKRCMPGRDAGMPGRIRMPPCSAVQRRRREPEVSGERPDAGLGAPREAGCCCAGDGVDRTCGGARGCRCGVAAGRLNPAKGRSRRPGTPRARRSPLAGPRRAARRPPRPRRNWSPATSTRSASSRRVMPVISASPRRARRRGCGRGWCGRRVSRRCGGCARRDGSHWSAARRPPGSDATGPASRALMLSSADGKAAGAGSSAARARGVLRPGIPPPGRGARAVLR